MTAVSLAGYRHISLHLLPVTPHDPRYDILSDTPMRRDLQHRLDDPVEQARRALEGTRTPLKRLDDEDRAAARA